ncbi:DUF3180 domain-containing protein [Catellatospora sp. KI3]|uniref:DUF3180 domain-containing protein n=1 Tax=Catellatospora sp. KI3 TaxID=3041620 RepID=UPI00248242EA|nr:DUF3180 domain-containing protein [Catellatospora sp. KI3]MDI1465098.1 DUF3180 domain-containing protein [Catellatospora sp. KI3]
MSQQPPPEPRLQPTSAATLVVAALAAAAVAWLVISNWYGKMPQLPWLPAFTLLALAIVEFTLAQQTRARIERRPGRPRVEPLAVARYVVLAKASSLAGAIFLGFFSGLALWLLVDGQRLAAADRDLPPAVVSVACSAALVGAALWLERACRVPKQPDQDNSEQP